MAATTLATSLELIQDYVSRELITEHFLRGDPLSRRLPWVRSPSGYAWTQKYTSEPSGATGMGIYGTMTASAFTVDDQSRFLNLGYKMDDRPYALSSQGEGDGGFSDRLTKKKHIFAGLSKWMRQKTIVGNPASGGVAIGATLAALLGADGDVEPSMNHFTFEDVHGRAGVSTTQGSFKWVNATQTLSYMAPGDTAYGEGQVITATNYFRVPLYSGGAVTGSKNYNKFVRVTVTPATIMAAGDYTSAATALTCVTYTPGIEPTGLYYQVTPDRTRWHDLTESDGCPADGGSTNRQNLTQMKMWLLDASNENPSQCFMAASDNLYNALEGQITSLGASVDAFNFMGETLNTLNYGGIGIFRNPWIPENLSSRSGDRSDLTYLIGGVLGSDGVHMKYDTFSDDVIQSIVAARQNGGSPLDETAPKGGGPSYPIQYWEDIYSPTSLIAIQAGALLMEPVSARADSLCMIYGLQT